MFVFIRITTIHFEKMSIWPSVNKLNRKVEIAYRYMQKPVTKNGLRDKHNLRHSLFEEA